MTYAFRHKLGLFVDVMSSKEDGSDLSTFQIISAMDERIQTLVALSQRDLQANVLPPVSTTSEGWCISNGSDDLDQIQTDDALGLFKTDVDAWSFVLRRALDGSAFHKAAIRRIKENNPVDFNLMMTSVC